MGGAQEAGVAGARGQRDVHRRALGGRAADLVGEARAREQADARLVQGDGEHAGVVVEDRLRAVAVVRVHVDVGHALRAEVQQALDGHGAVVVDAEPGRRGPGGVVHAAGEVHGAVHLAGPDRLRGDEGAARDPGGGLVQVREHGTVLGAQAEAAVLGRRRRRGPADGGDVLGVVDEGELLVRGHGRLHDPHVGRVQQAERLHEPVREIQPQGRHRVLRAEPVAEQAGVPHHSSGGGSGRGGRGAHHGPA